MAGNVPTPGEVVDFGNEICQPCTKGELEKVNYIENNTRVMEVTFNCAQRFAATKGARF